MPSGEPPALGDRRFASADWAANPPSAFLAEMYLLNARTLLRLAKSVEGDAKTQARIRFAVLQWIDAAAPSNFLALNPEAQKKAIETNGESLAARAAAALGRHPARPPVADRRERFRGRPQRRDDERRGDLRERAVPADRVRAADARRSTSGRSLFVPPCINKFYILDLQPENSLIRHTVAEGHRVFVVSWKNAGEEIAQRTWDDYIEAPSCARSPIVQEITGQEQINTLGFCIGGTILATALAVRRARGRTPAASMTLLTTFLDFSETGILDIFGAHSRHRGKLAGDVLHAGVQDLAVRLVIAFGRPFHGRQDANNLLFADLHGTADRAFVGRAVAQGRFNEILAAEQYAAALRSEETLAAADAEHVGADPGEFFQALKRGHMAAASSIKGTCFRRATAMASFSFRVRSSPYSISIMAVLSLMAASSSRILPTSTRRAPVSAMLRSHTLRWVMITSFFMPAVSGRREILSGPSWQCIGGRLGDAGGRAAGDDGRFGSGILGQAPTYGFLQFEDLDEMLGGALHGAMHFGRHERAGVERGDTAPVDEGANT